ncbi:hypothetical protein [Microbacterium sp. NPDC097977]|uniref:hypothetical protein n=1 Tax=Microbacterium sp. NPDC097977 TaxID=3155686 RepID=UPI00332149FA
MLQWNTLGEEKFNRAAEHLIIKTVEADNPGLIAEAVDGRGGDGGIDIDVRVKKTGQLISIYQLKYFPGGFSGGHGKARRPQVSKSYLSALEHEPVNWYLVIPENYTPGERKFVTKLRNGALVPNVRRIGKTELDAMLMRFPVIEDYINRDAAVSALAVVGREETILAKPGDSFRALERIKERADARSPYWGSEIGWLNGAMYERIVAKRPDAGDREPLNITVETDFTGAEELGAQYQRAIDYGLMEPLRIPREVITRVERHGPEWFAGVLDVHHIDLPATAGELTVPVRLKLKSPDGRLLAQPTALEARATSGSKGFLLTLTVVRGVTFEFSFVKEDSHGGDVDFQANLEGLTGVEARAAYKFLSALAKATSMTLEIRDIPPLDMEFSSNGTAPRPQILELAEDLAAIEDELGVRFSFPARLPGAVERIMIRALRRVLEGEVSYLPGAQHVGARLFGPLAIRPEMLTDSGINFGLEVDDWEWNVLGQTIILGDTTIAIFDSHAEGGAEHLAAFNADPGTARDVVFQPNHPLGGVVVYSRERRDMNTAIEPVAWGLSGFKEHPRIAE